MAAAQRTAWPPQVQALGRVLAAGLIASDDAVNVPQFALSAMIELGRLHIVLLDLLVRYEPDRIPPSSIQAIPHTVPSYQPTYIDGSGPLEWGIGRRKWSAAHVVSVRPQLQSVLAGVAGTLVRHGLAEQNDRRIEVMERITRDLQQMAETGIRPPVSTPAAPRHTRYNMDRSWSPTELGEQVLGFYLEAGAESLDQEGV